MGSVKKMEFDIVGAQPQTICIPPGHLSGIELIFMRAMWSNPAETGA